MHHHVAVIFRVLSDGKRTATLQSGKVVERVSLDRLVISPKHISPFHTIPHSATASDMRTKKSKWRSLEFNRVVEHRDMSARSLEFKIYWEGDYLAT